MRKMSAIVLVTFSMLFAGLGSAQVNPLVIDSTDFNYAIGIDSSFYQFKDYHMGSTGILPFDVTDTEWDFSALVSGTFSTVQVLNPATTPGSANYPGATGCSKSVFAGDTTYMYEDVKTNGHFWMGYYASILGYDIIGDFNPDMKAYHFPMQVGTMWYTSSIYTYTILGLPITTTETHQSEVVAQGRVKTHDIPYWMECLVIKTFHTYSDTAGSSDTYWLYEWVVPNGFSGGNGVAALMSQNQATSDFVFCRYALILGPTNITPDLPLMVDTDEVSETGGTVNYSIYAGEVNAGRNYILLGGATGTTPGTALPGGYVTLPLNWDPMTDLFLQFLNTSLCVNFYGQLNANGEATAQLNMPPLPAGHTGTVLYFAYALNSYFDYVSNPVDITIVP
ncbi:MAG: hypothetical protein ABIK28_14310 [Planctomycetota bacterium]